MYARKVNNNGQLKITKLSTKSCSVGHLIYSRKSLDICFYRKLIYKYKCQVHAYYL